MNSLELIGLNKGQAAFFISRYASALAIAENTERTVYDALENPVHVTAINTYISPIEKNKYNCEDGSTCPHLHREMALDFFEIAPEGYFGINGNTYSKLEYERSSKGTKKVLGLFGYMLPCNCDKSDPALKVESSVDPINIYGTPRIKAVNWFSNATNTGGTVPIAITSGTIPTIRNR